MDLFDLDLWKQQWQAFMNAPYIIAPFIAGAGLAGWWLRALKSGRKIDGLAGRIALFEDRLKFASEKAESANQAKDEVERQFQIYKAEVTANSGADQLTILAAKVDAAIAQFSAASNAVSSAIDSPFASRWPLAQRVIDYIALSLAISRHEACLVLQQRLLDRSIKARGPINSASASEIDSEFWRFAPPDQEGKAYNISTIISLPWFEVCAKDVLLIWPENRKAE